MYKRNKGKRRMMRRKRRWKSVVYSYIFCLGWVKTEGILMC